MAIEAIAKSAVSFQSGGEAVTVKTAVAPTERATTQDYTEVAVTPTLAGSEVAAENVKKTQTRDSEEAQVEKKPTNAQMKKAVEELNKKMGNSEAIFGIHEKTNRVTIKIVDKKTKEVLREFPPEETLDMIAKVWELAGIMVDEKR